MFYTIRAIIGIVLFIICLIIINKKRFLAHKRRLTIVSFIMVLLLTTVTFFVPVENLFITFPTLESSYKYNNSNCIDLIVDGEKSAFVVGSQNDIDNYFIVPKSNDGWKLGMGFNKKIIEKKILDDIIIYLYQYKGTNDYYITIFNVKRDSLNISDSINSKFQYTEKYNNVECKNYYAYFAYIGNLNYNYTLTVNGKTIKMVDERFSDNNLLY